MKNLFRLTMMSVLLGLLSLAAFAGTTPDTMHISCEAPNPDHQTGLHRARGDSDVWTFQIVLDGNAHFVDGPYWDYPGKSGNDPDWGLWTGGDDGDSSLGWSSPEKSDKFSIRVNGQIVCGDGGDGAPIDFSAGWDGEVSYNAEIKVRRKDSGDEYSSSATVAVGGKSTSEHQADVKVVATDSDGNPMEGISVDAPTINEENDYVDNKANISPSSATTNSGGEAFFTFTSSDVVKDMILEADGGMDSVGANIAQDWTKELPDNGNWPAAGNDESFEYEVPSNIAFKMVLGASGTPPISGHSIRFITVSIGGFTWDSQTGFFVHKEYQADDVPQISDLVTYSTDNNDASESSPGVYDGSMTVDKHPNFHIDSVTFAAVDYSAYE